MSRAALASRQLKVWRLPGKGYVDDLIERHDSTLSPQGCLRFCIQRLPGRLQRRLELARLCRRERAADLLPER
jgi:hypothetical protein